MIFQNPRGSLNPVLTVGDQIEQVLKYRQGLNKAQARERAIELLRLVHIPEPERRLKAYPHQLSGGMAQRVMIAMAISCGPQLLIADEPTTGLDVTIEYQIIQLLKEMRDLTGTSVIVITHDLNMAAEVCDRIMVMYAGKVVEQAPVREFFTKPSHPYTLGLLASRPSLSGGDEIPTIPGNVPDLDPIGRPAAHSIPVAGGQRRNASRSSPNHEKSRPGTRQRATTWRRSSVTSLLRIESLKKYYPIRTGMFSHKMLHAIDGVSLDMQKGETVGLVGESGSGKSTVAKCATLLEKPTDGTIEFEGKNLTTLSFNEMTRARANDPDGLSGSIRLAQSSAHGGADRPRTDQDSQYRVGASSQKIASPSCSTGSDCVQSIWRAIHTSFPAASSSALASLGHWRRIQN